MLGSVGLRGCGVGGRGFGDGVGKKNEIRQSLPLGNWHLVERIKYLYNNCYAKSSVSISCEMEYPAVRTAALQGTLVGEFKG